MQRSLIIALAVFVAVAVGLGWYVHVFNTSGADASAYMAGYMLPLLGVAGAGVWLSTRKKVNWTSQDRLATTMLIAAAFAVVLHGSKISEAYYARQMVGAITTANTPNDAMKSLTSLESELGRLMARVNEMNVAAHTEAATLINNVEMVAGGLNDVYFETIQNRERLRGANETLTRLVAQAREGQVQIKSTFEKLRRDVKAVAAQSGVGPKIEASFVSGFDETTTAWGDWYGRRIAFTERSVQALLDLQLFVTAQNGQYRVVGQMVHFPATATADRYNELTANLRNLVSDGERLDAENDALQKKVQAKLESMQAVSRAR